MNSTVVDFVNFARDVNMSCEFIQVHFERQLLNRLGDDNNIIMEQCLVFTH